MGRVGEVLALLRRVVQGIPLLQLQLDRGGGVVSTADVYGPPGDDSPPLPGDYVAALDGRGSGQAQAVGFHDPTNAGQAVGGEKRLYGRNAAGEIVSTVWLRGDGSVAIESTGPISVVGSQVRLGDGSAYIATAGDLVAVTIPPLTTATGPVFPVGVPAPSAAPVITGAGQILPRQTRSRA